MDLACHLKSAFLVGLRQYENKLFPAIPGGKIALAGLLAESFGNLHEGRIAAVVTIGIVACFEVVDIQDEKGEGIVISLRAFKFFMNFLLEGATIEKSGQ